MYLLQTVTSQYIVDKLVFLVVFFGTVFALIKTAEVFAKERSVGKEALKKVEKDVEDLKKEASKYAGENEELQRVVHRLDTDFKDLLKDTLQYYQSKTRGR